MLAIKNRIAAAALAPVLGLALAGCTPPGPRALLEGQRLLDAGKPREAVERLTVATQLLATNAQAWNYLGLARHQTGDAAGATQAYQQALRLNRDLFEAHFNLGCLWLEQGKPDLARNEFTACTMRRPNALEAWLKLGAAHLRLGELAAAEEAFQKAQRLAPGHPEALNGLGLVHAQRRRPREAAQFFTEALKPRPPYRPALLNLATVLHRDLNDPAGAARRYREYLALEPREPDWESVNAVLQTLERPLMAALPAPATNIAPAAAVPATNLVKPPPPPPTPALARTNPAPASPPATSTPTTNPATTKTQPAPSAPPTAPPIAPTAAATAVIANPAPPPVVQPSASPAAVASAESAPAPAPAPAPATTAPTEKRGFLARLNPFRREPKPTRQVTALPPASNAPALASPPTAPDSPAPSTPPGTIPRYHYLSPTPPAAGDRVAAETALARGLSARAAGRLTEAAQALQAAVEADPASFEARYQLGLAQFALKDYAAATATFEWALALRSDSTDARYALALALKAGGYALDAAAELETLLAAAPDEVRAHLVLGNLYAEQLQDRGRARVHYQRVLELDPRHPQATQIRYWLVANPA
jgi:tetratricopeptide (TPR) repeat protein